MFQSLFEVCCGLSANGTPTGTFSGRKLGSESRNEDIRELELAQELK